MGASPRRPSASGRRRWTRPQLIVLARTTGDELVLAGCKGNGQPLSSLTHHLGCHSDSICTTSCRDQYTS